MCEEESEGLTVAGSGGSAEVFDGFDRGFGAALSDGGECGAGWDGIKAEFGKGVPNFGSLGIIASIDEAGGASGLDADFEEARDFGSFGRDKEVQVLIDTSAADFE